FDVGAARPLLHEPNKTADGVFLALEDRLNRAVPAVRDTAGDTVLLRAPTRRVAKDHYLHAAVGDETSAHHATHSPAAVHYRERYRQPDKIDESGAEIEWPVPYWYVDAGKAAMLVLLAAIDEGLAAGVFGVPAERMEDFRALLGLPPEVAVVEVITIGHPAEDRVSDERSS